MPLPARWVEHLFGRLQVRYGAAFARQWTDLDMDAVKADWSDVLDGTSGTAIEYALRYLPERPVNALQFRDICRRAPLPTHQALPAPTDRADPGRVASIMARLRADDGPPMSLGDKCAANILRLVANAGGRVSIAQRQQLEAMAWREDAGQWVKGRPLAVLDAEGVH